MFRLNHLFKASCLFYNPSKGCYLKYNPRTLQYVEIGNPTPETKSEEMSRSEVAVDTESPRISEHGIKTEPQEFINYSEGSSIVSGYMYDKASGYYYNTVSSTCQITFPQLEFLIQLKFLLFLFIISNYLRLRIKRC